MSNSRKNRQIQNQQPVTEEVTPVVEEVAEEVKEGAVAEEVKEEPVAEEVAEEVKESEVKTEKAVVSNCGKLRLRATPVVKEDNVIDELPVDTEVEVINASNDWSKIKANGKEGFAMSKYLKISK